MTLPTAHEMGPGSCSHDQPASQKRTIRTVHEEEQRGEQVRIGPLAQRALSTSTGMREPEGRPWSASGSNTAAKIMLAK